MPFTCKYRIASSVFEDTIFEFALNVVKDNNFNFGRSAEYASIVTLSGIGDISSGSWNFMFIY